MNSILLTVLVVPTAVAAALGPALWALVTETRRLGARDLARVSATRLEAR